MFTVLARIKKQINKDIVLLDELLEEHPENDLLFAELCGLKIALRTIAREESKEYSDLDKWAESEMKRRGTKNEHNNRK